MSEKYKDIEEAIKFLEEIVEVDGTELGEFLDYLVHIYRYDYCFSGDDMRNAIEKEIFAQADFFDENYRIVEREEVIVTPNRTVKIKEFVEKE